MDFFAWAWTTVLGHLQAVFNANSPYGPVALGGALVFTVLFYVDARRQRGRRVSLAGFIRSIFPSRIVRHPSSRLDLRLWIANTVVFASAYAMLAIGGFLWRDATARRWSRIWPARARGLAGMGDPGVDDPARVARL